MSENEKLSVIEMRGVEVCSMLEPGTIVVENVEWTVAQGEFWIVAGQQQSGKTDLLMMTAGLMTPTNGTYKLFGIDTKSLREAELAERLRVGFVFEDGQLFKHMTLAENIALPLQYHRDLPQQLALEQAQPLIDLMDLTAMADVTPENAGINWVKRAALARALVLKPEVLLLDNPVSGLGAHHVRWWRQFLDQLWRGHEWFGGKPMTIVATAEDLRLWKSDTRRFALLHDRALSLLGSWREVASQDDTIIMELMEVAGETMVIRKD